MIVVGPRYYIACCQCFSNYSLRSKERVAVFAFSLRIGIVAIVNGSEAAITLTE